MDYVFISGSRRGRTVDEVAVNKYLDGVDNAETLPEAREVDTRKP